MSSPAMHHYPSAQKEFKPPLVANENAYLGAYPLPMRTMMQDTTSLSAVGA